MEEKGTMTKEPLEFLLNSFLLRGRRNTSFVPESIETSASPEEGGAHYKGVHSYQAARITRRSYQARDSNCRR
jgi:hypothetical protein